MAPHLGGFFVAFVDNPVLNSPYRPPTRHFHLNEDETPRLRAVRFVAAGEVAPRLVTAYPLGEGEE